MELEEDSLGKGQEADMVQTALAVHYRPAEGNRCSLELAVPVASYYQSPSLLGDPSSAILILLCHCIRHDLPVHRCTVLDSAEATDDHPTAVQVAHVEAEESDMVGYKAVEAVEDTVVAAHTEVVEAGTCAERSWDDNSEAEETPEMAGLEEHVAVPDLDATAVEGRLLAEVDGLHRELEVAFRKEAEAEYTRMLGAMRDSHLDLPNALLGHVHHDHLAEAAHDNLDHMADMNQVSPREELEAAPAEAVRSYTQPWTRVMW
jgi:hypothetical protein